MMARTSTAAWTAAVCAIAIGVGGHLSARAADKAPAKSTGPVSMTGCLRVDGSSYVLSGLKGDQAPRARSWKTGYIIKTTKDVVLSPAAGMKLQDHVGRQVTVVGVVDGAHMTARTIRRIATSCS
jgi:hypothetical protein